MHGKVSVIPLHIPIRGVVTHRGYLERHSHEHTLTHLTFETLCLGQDVRETSHRLIPSRRVSLAGQGSRSPEAFPSVPPNLQCDKASGGTVHPLLPSSAPCEAGPMHFGSATEQRRGKAVKKPTARGSHEGFAAGQQGECC